MKFAKLVFLIAGIYGLIVLIPQYFLEGKTGRDFPPEITHPEYYYGFIGVALAWQVAFLIIARDPVRYRLLMIPGVLEKSAFTIAVAVLYVQQRVGLTMLLAGMIDLIFVVLFVMAFMSSRQDGQDTAD
jgi:hypothetical protein